MTTGFIGILAFIAGTLAYPFNPALADSTVYVLRNCVPHPWIAKRSTYPAIWAKYLEFMKRTLQKVAN